MLRRAPADMLRFTQHPQTCTVEHLQTCLLELLFKLKVTISIYLFITPHHGAFVDSETVHLIVFFANRFLILVSLKLFPLTSVRPTLYWKSDCEYTEQLGASIKFVLKYEFFVFFVCLDWNWILSYFFLFIWMILTAIKCCTLSIKFLINMSYIDQDLKYFLPFLYSILKEKT